MADRIMTHMVAFYPDRERTLDVARALADGGASYLEVQFPFSEPTADGPVIQTACARALAQGFTVDGGFGLVERIAKACGLPIFIMNYANPVFRRGVERYVGQCRDSGASGLIVPDLPVDCDEGLYAAARTAGLDAVPVVAPTITEERIGMIAKLKPRFVYAALRKGITGAATEIGEDNLAFIARLRTVGADILAGFGIGKRSQVRALAPHVHACIVGSALISAASGAAPYEAVRARVESLV